MELEKLVGESQIIAVVCNQWGDTGKGKFSDYFASHWADVTARGTGGNNAGHTVVVNGKERIFHLLPTGITNDRAGRVNILGNGMVIDLSVLNQELDELDKENFSYQNLMISEDANVIMPYHILRDKAKDQSQKGGGVGSTGRGIGPAYSDKIGRRGIIIRDLYNKDLLAKKIKRSAENYSEIKIDSDEVIENLKPYAQRIKPFVRDTVTEMHGFVRAGKKILIEGAQGLLLSVEHGTYPYVTSSDCSLNGTAGGVGLSAGIIDKSFGIVKFPFMTRVGGGPFPTELGGRKSEEYCAATNEDGYPKYNKILELERHGARVKEFMNSSDEFEQGIGIRIASREYGATTGRPRRIGWTDAISARYAVAINGPLIILTKADALADADNFNICYGYKNSSNSRSDFFKKDEAFLRGVSPVYTAYNGFGDISEIRDYEKLPSSLKLAVEEFEKFTGGKVEAISVGAEREATIIR